MRILIIAGLPNSLPEFDYDTIVGVDAGALWAVKNDLALDVAVGDFDSVSDEEMIQIIQSGAEVHKLNPIKDETDFEVALSDSLENHPDAKIRVIGALGGRLDHELTNIFLATTPKFSNFARQIMLQNEHNIIQYFSAGKNRIKQIAGMKYIGFIKVGADNFSIENAKYPLKAVDNFSEIYASNEFLADDELITINFTSGVVIAIHSSDTKLNVKAIGDF
ncbi:thiamine diphosphokinase [Lactovum miscens]|uniref:Thiamine diphosphokinase n=1 Tax=Lactovum miscens TaxID=190387 RepID=A0A841C8A9_9LACT|nr:thiamine diphosphokinase [Lactovum miscens]MBB5888584.1 thiamine pyrophosphokinase [Lactovum miscens]